MLGKKDRIVLCAAVVVRGSRRVRQELLRKPYSKGMLDHRPKVHHNHLPSVGQECLPR